MIRKVKKVNCIKAGVLEWLMRTVHDLKILLDLRGAGDAPGAAPNWQTSIPVLWWLEDKLSRSTLVKTITKNWSHNMAPKKGPAQINRNWMTLITTFHGKFGLCRCVIEQVSWSILQLISSVKIRIKIAWLHWNLLSTKEKKRLTRTRNENLYFVISAYTNTFIFQYANI